MRILLGIGLVLASLMPQAFASEAGILAKLEGSLAKAERIPAQVEGPRANLYSFYLETFRMEMLRLRSGADRAKLDSPITDQLSFANLSRGSARSLARIAYAYHVVFRLNLYLNFNSILVEKEPEASQAEIRALDQEMGELRRMVESFWPGAAITRHAVFMRAVHFLAQGIEENLALVDEAKRAEVASWVDEVETLGTTTPRLNDVKIKAMVSEARYARVKAALRNVNLPDSGEVEGLAEAIEQATMLQANFDLIDHLFANDDWRNQ